MNSSFRWQTWLPRLLFAAVALLAAQFVAGLALRSLAKQSLARATGGEADVDHARLTLIDRQVVLTDLRVGNPVQPRTNLFEADWCELDFAAGPLLHKQAVVESGTVSGLRLGTPREAGDAVAHREPAPMGRSLQWFNDEYPDRAQDWMEHLNRRFDPELIKQSHAIRRTAALSERLPQQSAALTQQAEALTLRAEAVQKELENATVNPLRHAKYLEDAPDEVSSLREEFDELTADVKRLADLVDAQRPDIVAARRQDDKWLREQLQVETLEPDAITAYLLCEQLGQPVDQLLGWLRLAREMVPSRQATTLPIERQGEEICFAGCDRAPGFLVRALALEGSACIGGQPVELHGMLSNFSSQPEWHQEPMRLRLTTAGSLPLVLQASIDRTGSVAHDELLVDGREIILPKSSLGDCEHLRFMIGPSVGTLSIRVRVDGERLTGEIQLAQRQVQLVSCVGGDLNDVPLGEALDDALADVHSLETRLTLSGTLDEPKCALWSNLGPAVSQVLDIALRRATDTHAHEMQAQIERQVNEQLDRLERKLADDEATLLRQLSQAASELEKIAAQHESKQRITPEQLGRSLPENSLFRK